MRLAEGLQRREMMMQKRTMRKTAREMSGNASIRTGISEGGQEQGTWEAGPPSDYFTCYLLGRVDRKVEKMRVACNLQQL